MIVITGGAGFIGSALVWGLNQRGIDDIIVVDSLKKGSNPQNLINLKFRDFIDKDEFIGRLEEGEFEGSIDGILHMGAVTDTTERDITLLLKSNYEYTKKLALWCVKKNRRFVYASTAATYGDGKMGFLDDETLLLRLKPLNMYGYSKHLFDIWALNNKLLDKITGLKYFNVFGPNEYHKGEMRSVAHKAFEQIEREGKVRLFKSYHPEFKDGRQMRDFIYIKDAVDMTLFIYEKKEAKGIFNLGTGKARSFYDLVVAIFKEMSQKPKIDYIDIPEYIRERYQYFTQADITKLHSIGYKKKIHSLEEAISDYVRNYLLMDNPYLGR